MTDPAVRRPDPDHAAARNAVKRMAGGDQAALADLYDVHASTIYTLAVRMLADASEAEDVVQEVFAQAWHQAARYDATRATVIGWLLMMTRTRAIDRLRSRQSRPDRLIATPLPEVISETPGQESELLTGESASRLREALRQLGDVLRTPIELAYFEGLTQVAIAERLGQPLGTVKTRMRTALLRLRSVLTKEEGR